MTFLGWYFKEHRLGIGLFFLFSLIFLIVFALYRLPVEAVIYPVLLCTASGILVFAWDIRRVWKKHRQLQELLQLPAALMESFPPETTLWDQDYRQIIEALRRQQSDTENRLNLRYMDMADYYTVWAHQIKTPIASMRLTLQNEDSPLSRRLTEDLFRIEQYVEMVLCYLRLDSDSTDYVFGPCDLDGVLRQAIRRFSTQFIVKKLNLHYEPVHCSPVTDEKWLLFVVEQVLSNAVKYTPGGGEIEIGLEEEETLYIRDTGIGIAPEDLPRIFEKGYTGYNGRSDKKASGIGLYLCRRICDNLGHRISAQSAPRRGTCIRITFQEQKKAGERPE